MADPGGEIHFAIVPGTYDVEISAKGFQDQTNQNCWLPTRDSEPMDVVLHVGDQPDHCGFLNTVDYKAIKPNLGALSGRVIDADWRIRAAVPIGRKLEGVTRYAVQNEAAVCVLLLHVEAIAGRGAFCFR